MKNKITFLNAISSIIVQFLTVISGFIIPRLILTYFGSEANGLVSSIAQFLSYISLVEGGVTGVISASLYKPLVDKDNKKISSIIKTANIFYKKIALIIVIYSIILAVIYPIIFKTSYSFMYVSALVIILAFALFNQYAFALTLRTLLVADKKGYIESIVKSIIIIFTIILSVLSVKIFPSIHLLKMISALLFLIQPIVYSQYIKKNYNIDKYVEIDNKLLKNRWNGFAVNVAAFIHFSTDVAILTIFTNFKVVSIYSVYCLISNGLTNIINSFSSAFNPSIGQLYARGNNDDLNNKLSQFEIITFLLVYYLFSVGILLITPFVMIYTKGITDINYNQPLFGTLLLISQALYLIKNPHVGLAYSANKFKEITVPCYIEAFINIFVSLILVGKFGLLGVTVGTIVGMIYRLIFQIRFTSTELIKNRKQLHFYKKMIIFTLLTLLAFLICKISISSVEFTIFSFIYHGIIYSIIFLIIYIVGIALFYKSEFKCIINYFIKK